MVWISTVLQEGSPNYKMFFIVIEDYEECSFTFKYKHVDTK